VALRKSSVVYSVKGLGMKTPALFTSQVDSSEIADGRIHRLLRYIVTCDIAVNELQTISGLQRFGRRDISRVCNYAVPCLKKPFCDSAADGLLMRRVTIATFVLTGVNRAPTSVAAPFHCVALKA